MPSPHSDSSFTSTNHGPLDLNLLTVFDALMHERNLTRAGRRIALSQPATSHALARLRHMLNDDLFIRTPDGMDPTPRAIQMSGPVRDALRVLQLTLEPESFDPAQSSRHFSILVNNYAARTIVPRLSHMVAEAAPKVLLDVRPIGKVDVLDQLDAGGAEIALTSLVDGGERFKCVRVTDDDYVALLDSQHPAAGGDTLSLERLAEIPHVVITSIDDTSFVDEALEHHGLGRNIAIRAPFLSVVLLLVGSDRLAVAPRRAALSLLSVCPLAMQDLPFASPRLELSMIWHRRLDNHPAQRWIRSMVRTSAQH